MLRGCGKLDFEAFRRPELRQRNQGGGFARLGNRPLRSQDLRAVPCMQRLPIQAHRQPNNSSSESGRVASVCNSCGFRALLQGRPDPLLDLFHLIASANGDNGGDTRGFGFRQGSPRHI